MKVLRVDDAHFEGGKSIFLAGPNTRCPEVPSWRVEALQILGDLQFDGSVLIPEPDDVRVIVDANYQKVWEQRGLTLCTIIAFWVPRDMKTLPGLHTNIEFGHWLAKDPDKVIYGRPDCAEFVDYLDWMYKDLTGRTFYRTLSDTLEAACHRLRSFKHA